MNIRRRKVSMKEQLEDAIAEIGGEPLAGSGFENGKPDEAVSYRGQSPSISAKLPAKNNSAFSIGLADFRGCQLDSPNMLTRLDELHFPPIWQ
jgi:hypothetical protein